MAGELDPEVPVVITADWLGAPYPIEFALFVHGLLKKDEIGSSTDFHFD